MEHGGWLHRRFGIRYADALDNSYLFLKIATHFQFIFSFINPRCGTSILWGRWRLLNTLAWVHKYACVFYTLSKFPVIVYWYKRFAHHFAELTCLGTQDTDRCRQLFLVKSCPLLTHLQINDVSVVLHILMLDWCCWPVVAVVN